MPQYTRRSAAAVVMCDVTRKDTLEGARQWKDAVDKSVYLPNGQPIPCVLLVNKVGGCMFLILLARTKCVYVHAYQDFPLIKVYTCTVYSEDYIHCSVCCNAYFTKGPQNVP